MLKKESGLVPYEAVKKIRQGRALVFAPHPDDEVFGCGGAIVSHLRDGDPVQVVILTDGGHPLSPEHHGSDYPVTRRKESLEAASVLGYGEPVFWDFPDQGLEYNEKLIAKILEFMVSYRPEIVYLPNYQEIHPDHRVTSAAVTEAARRHQEPVTLAYYEVGQPITPNLLLDISDIREQKQKAIACFVSQLKVQSYLEQVSALNIFRTYTLPKTVIAAEAYFIIETSRINFGSHLWYVDLPSTDYSTVKAIEEYDFPLVSVIVRTMNRPELRDALKSIAMQTYPMLEIVVVDSRGSGELHLDEWCGRYPLRVVCAGKPLNRPAAANQGLQAIKGEYFCFLDEDDLLHPDHVNNLVSNFRFKAAPAIYSGIDRTDENLQSELIYNDPFDQKRLFWENYIPIHALLFNSAAVSKACRFDERFEIYEDWDFLIQVSLLGEFIHIDQITGLYRILGSSEAGGSSFDQKKVEQFRRLIFSKWRPYWTDDQFYDFLIYVSENSPFVKKFRELSGSLEEQNKKLKKEVESQKVSILSFEEEKNNLLKAFDEKLTSIKKEHINEKAAIVNEFRNTLSWKITAPLRFLKGTTLHIIRNKSLKGIFRSAKKKSFVLESCFLAPAWHSDETTLFLSGWYIPEEISDSAPKVSIIVNGHEIGRLDFLYDRPDVVDVSWNRNFPCGFSSSLTVGSSKLLVILKDNHSGKVLAKRKMKVEKPDAPGSNFFLRKLSAKAKNRFTLSDFTKPGRIRHYLKKAIQEYKSHRASLTNFDDIHNAVSDYQAYCEQNKISQHLSVLLKESVNAFHYKPLFSIIMPVYNVDPKWIEQAVSSVQDQIYPYWEMCLADDASTDESTKKFLRSIQSMPGINICWREKNGNISEASNSAISMAKGDFVFLMDQDDVLAPNALFELARKLQDDPELDLLYADEDKISTNNIRYDPQFKPEWSYFLLLGYNYINHPTCIRRSLVDEVGWFRKGFDGAQDYDLLLRVVEKTNRIAHIPKVLYHWRAISGSTAASSTEKPAVKIAARKALEEHLKRIGQARNIYEPRFAMDNGLPVFQLDGPDTGQEVQIIIPAKDKHELTRKCVDSILEKTTYKNYKILLVDNDSRDPRSKRYYESIEHPKIKVLKILNPEQGFSFSYLMNEAVRKSDSPLVLFLNNDMEVIEPRWLSRMMAYGGFDNTGTVGARLLYPDSNIQHAGILLSCGKDRAPAHAFRGLSSKKLSYYFLAETASEKIAVTGACMLVKRSLFLDIGGFDEDMFPVSLNDVDLCLRMWDKGYWTVYCSGAELLHYEATTRPKEDEPEDLKSFRIKHGLKNDPFYSRNLSRDGCFNPLPDSMLDYDEYIGMPLKVMLYSHNFNWEGSSKVIYNIALGLKERKGFEPMIISPVDGPARDSLENAGIKTSILPAVGTENILQGWDNESDYEKTKSIIKDFLVSHSPDVVLANVINSYFVVTEAHSLGIPSVWIIHESYDNKKIACSVPPFAFIECENAFEKASHIIFVSQATKELYLRYNLRKRFRVVRNALHPKDVPNDLAAEDREIYKKRLGLSLDKIMVLSVGTVCERKDQETLVKAASKLKNQEVVFYLVGARMENSYTQRLQALIQKKGLEDTVFLIPETPDVHAYYAAADIFAFTSLNESYSLTIIEAMSYGLPIITTPVFGVGEQVKYNVNALGFGYRNADDLRQHIKKLADDQVLRLRMGKNSRDIFEYLDTYDEMIGAYVRYISTAWQQGITGSVLS